MSAYAAILGGSTCLHCYRPIHVQAYIWALHTLMYVFACTFVNVLESVKAFTGNSLVYCI